MIRFPTSDHLHCFHCETPLASTPARDDGYPAGEGRYSVACPHCAYRTWFDRLDVALKEALP